MLGSKPSYGVACGLVWLCNVAQVLRDSLRLAEIESKLSPGHDAQPRRPAVPHRHSPTSLHSGSGMARAARSGNGRKARPRMGETRARRTLAGLEDDEVGAQDDDQSAHGGTARYLRSGWFR